MSLTTEKADWNKLPRAKRPESHPNSNTSRQPLLPHQSPTSQVDSSTLSTTRAGSFASTSTQIAKQVESQLSQTVTTTLSSLTLAPSSLPTNPVLTLANAGSSAAVSHNPPGWDAAREAVLSQMVTSQDLAATATLTPKVPRGGVKTGGRRGRGGRRTKVKIEAPDETPAKPTDTPMRAKNRGGRPRGSRAGVNRGGRPRGSRAGNSAAASIGRGSKRKRKKGDEDEDGKDDTDSSEEFTPLAHTSSGRRINQVKTFSPVVLDPAKGLSSKKVPQTAPVAEPPSTAKKSVKRRRRAGEAAVCINCGRGHSPASNMIVFCDGCNNPWHQFCHDRPITPSVIQIEEKEWICLECNIIKEEAGHIAGKVAADKMTIGEKRTYFQGLEKAELVSLLLHACTLHEELPVFAPPPPPPPLPELPRWQGWGEEEEVYEVYVEPDPLPYPKAGNGIILPPEDDDLDILIDEDVVTYSHLWKGSAGWEGPNGMRWPFPGGMGMGLGPVPISVGA